MNGRFIKKEKEEGLETILGPYNSFIQIILRE
jgi:hypothetical protein